jgi:predicted enzyme related to lactoylglutathione lyase
VVRCTCSPARAWWPAVVARLARTLGSSQAAPVAVHGSSQVNRMSSLVSDAQVNIYSADPVALASFYTALGLTEKFRFPPSGKPDQLELLAGTLTLGFTSTEALFRLAGIDIKAGAPRSEVVLWCADADSLYTRALQAGGKAVAEPRDFNGRIRAAWVEDPQGNRVKLVSLVHQEPKGSDA